MRKILADNKKLYLFFLALSLLFYGNSIKNGFSFDDSYVTVTNIPVKGQKYTPNHPLVSQGIKAIPTIWRSHYGHGDGTSYDYRPVVITLFAIEYSIFGQSPQANHFINVLLYATICFFLFLLLKKCFISFPNHEIFALVCSVLFLAHPVHTEVVNNIKCRDELLALLFGILSIFNILKYFEFKRVKYLVFCFLFLFLALYSKLTSAIFVLLAPLTLFLFSNVKKKHVFFVLGGLVASFILFRRSRRLLITEKEVRYFFHFENPLYTEKLTFLGKILFALKTFGVYLKLLFFPYPLRFYYGSNMIPANASLLDWQVIFSILFLAGAFYYCYRKKDKIAFFGLLFFGISIGPLVNLIEPVAGIVGERLCFTPSIGFIIFITSVLFSFYKTRFPAIDLQLFTKKPLVYVSVVLVVSLFYTWNRNSLWKDEMTLFEHDAPFLEESAGANNLLANKYFDMLHRNNLKYSQKELVDKCLHHYGLAIKNDSSVYSAFNNAGVVFYSYLGDVRTALNYFIRAVNINHKYPQANENIGNCYDKLGKPELAIKHYRIAVSQNYMQRKSYVQMVKILIRQKRMKEASKLFEVTDRIFPNDYFLTAEKGTYYYQNQQFEAAAAAYEMAYQTKKSKGLAEALFNTYSMLRNDEKAAFYKNEFTNLQE